jgi:hypothetical protein
MRLNVPLPVMSSNQGHFASAPIASVRRGCYGFVFLLERGAISSCLHAAETTLLDYFHACGIGDDAFARFSDGRQMADDELDVIRRIAVRLRDCPADSFARLASRQESASGRTGHAINTFPAPAEARNHRGQRFHLQGTLVSTEPVEDDGSDLLWRYTLTQFEFPRRAIVYAVRRKKPPLFRICQPVALDGVFVKYVPGPGNMQEPMAVLVAPRLETRPDSPLGNVAGNFGPLEEITDRSALLGSDHDAFYRLLKLTQAAGKTHLHQQAESLITQSEFSLRCCLVFPRIMQEDHRPGLCPAAAFFSSS